MGPQYKYDVTNDVIDDEGRAELYSNPRHERRIRLITTSPVNRVSKLEDFLPWIFLCDVIACMVM